MELPEFASIDDCVKYIEELEIESEIENGLTLNEYLAQQSKEQ